MFKSWNRFALMAVQWVSDAYCALCASMALLLGYDLFFQHNALGMPTWSILLLMVMLSLALLVHEAAAWALRHHAY